MQPRRPPAGAALSGRRPPRRCLEASAGAGDAAERSGEGGAGAGLRSPPGARGGEAAPRMERGEKGTVL
ncbi:unnamed protein product [Gulo gulo]|uniref:Uncharacterized protein n=1 Tax=Gulo gulo TaxID=48420 RepID=A0A9X9LIC6_GULGU|nr:unnamed protein product [Gulo gulo]